MKQPSLIITTVFLLGVMLVSSCKDDEPEPLVDPFPGTWELLPMPSGKEVNSIEESPAGDMWFAVWGKGLWKYDGVNWKNLPNAFGTNEDTIIWDLNYDSRDNLWICSNKGLIRYDGISGYKYPKLMIGRCSGVLEHSTQGYWAIALSPGLLQIVDDSTITWGSWGAGFQDLFHSGGKDLIEDMDGNIWISTSHGIGKYDFQNWEAFQNLFDFSATTLGNEYVPELAMDHNGNIWAITWGGGVLTYDGQGWTTFTTDNGLVSNYGRAIMVAKNGDIWAGFNRGISKYDGQNWHSVTIEEEIKSEVRTLFEDSNGTIWIGTLHHGIVKYIP